MPGRHATRPASPSTATASATPPPPAPRRRAAARAGQADGLAGDLPAVLERVDGAVLVLGREHRGEHHEGKHDDHVEPPALAGAHPARGGEVQRPGGEDREAGDVVGQDAAAIERQRGDPQPPARRLELAQRQREPREEEADGRVVEPAGGPQTVRVRPRENEHERRDGGRMDGPQAQQSEHREVARRRAHGQRRREGQVQLGTQAEELLRQRDQQPDTGS